MDLTLGLMSILLERKIYRIYIYLFIYNAPHIRPQGLVYRASWKSNS
jgi:hypothetical protein